MIISDFHSAADAQRTEEEFNRIFRRNELPDEIEEVALESGVWKLPRLLVDLKLAPSMAEARRLIEQGAFIWMATESLTVHYRSASTRIISF